MTEPPKKPLTFHVLKNEELCTDGKPHDWADCMDLKDEQGRVRGSTTVCSRCGLDAMTHSLRYGP